MGATWTILTFLAVAAPVAGSDPDLAEIIRRHTGAVGGREAIEAVRNLEVALHIKEASFDVDGVYRVDRQGRMRIDVLLDGRRVYTEAFDGTRGWQMGEDGVAKDQKYAAALWHGTQFPGNVLGLHDLAARGHRVELKGREVVGGADYHVLRITLSDGFETLRYVNPTTWMIERGRDTRPLHPDVDPTPKTLETVWSDFREAGGVLRSHRSTQTDLGSGALLQTTTIGAIRLNPPLDEKVFARP